MIAGLDKDPFAGIGTLVSFSRSYKPWPITREAIDTSSDRTGKTLKIQIGNVKWSKLLGALRTTDVRNSVVVLRKIYWDISHLMENTVILFKGRIAELMFNEQQIELLAADLTWDFGRTMPDRIYSESCMHVFKGTLCGYLGPNTTCNKSWEDCTDNKANGGRFGGFKQISAGQVRNYVA